MPDEMEGRPGRPRSRRGPAAKPSVTELDDTYAQIGQLGAATGHAGSADALVEGMRERGYPETFARQLFKQILGFGEYGFPEVNVRVLSLASPGELVEF